MDRSLNETSTDKIRKYRGDHNNNPPSCVSFMLLLVHRGGSLNRKSATFSPSLQHCGQHSILMTHLWSPDHTLTHVSFTDLPLIIKSEKPKNFQPSVSETSRSQLWLLVFFTPILIYRSSL